MTLPRMVLVPAALWCVLLAASAFAQRIDIISLRRNPNAPGLTTDQRIGAAEKNLRESPNDPKAQMALAEAFIQKLRETTDFAYLNRASALVENVLATDPMNYDAGRLRIVIETHRHNFHKAVELAEQLSERNPSDEGTLGMLGDSLMELGRYDEARPVFNRMLELRPNLFSYNRIAYHEFVTGNAGRALMWMNLAMLAGSPVAENQAWLLVEFGDMLFKAGYAKEAHTIYDQALETLPGYHRAYGALGRFYAATGEYPRAVENLKKAEAVIPLPDYAAALERLYTKLGRPSEAARQRELLDIVDKLGVANGEKGNRMLAVIYADENRNLGRALELANGELATRQDVYTYDALSWVQFRAGHQKEAEEASAKALAYNTPEPMFLYHAGLISIAGGHGPEGQNLLRRALSLNPNFAFPQAEDARRRLAGSEPDAAKSQEGR